jgi:hypothetical protein
MESTFLPIRLFIFYCRTMTEITRIFYKTKKKRGYLLKKNSYPKFQKTSHY